MVAGDMCTFPLGSLDGVRSMLLPLDSSDPVLPAGEGVGDIGEGVLFRRLLQLF